MRKDATEAGRGTSAAGAGLVALLVSSLMVGLSATPVSAEPLVTDGIEAIAETVGEAAPDGTKPVEGTRTGDAIIADTRATEVTVPLDGDSAVQIVAASEGQELFATLSLPSGMDIGEGEVASDGTIIFAEGGIDEQNQGAVVVQALEDGSTRMQTVIASAESQHEFGYALGGFRATIDRQGQAGFISDGADGAYVPVAAPWATDANGNSVDTFYEVRGDRLFQIIVPDAGTAYPVVADPTWQWRNAAWGMTLNRKETASIKDYAVAAGMCAAFVKKAPIVACGVWASYLLTQAVTANKRKGCLHLVAAPLPGAVLHVKC